MPFSSWTLEIWSFTVYFSGKRRSLLHPNTAQGSFFPLQSYSKKTLRQNVPKSVRKYKRNVLMPPGHPINVLLKLNYFNMAAVLVKRSIRYSHTILSSGEVLISLIILLQVLLSSWCSARKVQLCFLRNLAFHLQNCRIQQKLHEMHKICLWLERIRSSQLKEFDYLLYNSAFY